MSEVINIKELNERIERESVFVDTLRNEMGKVIVGQSHLVDTLLIGLLSNGHILLEGVPGLAKTLAITTLAKAVDACFSRIQFTPDLLPADLIGTLIYSQKNEDFVVRKGSDLRQLRTGGRDQPLPGQSAVGAAGSHAGASGDHRRQHLSPAAAVPRAGHAEPPGAGGNLPAARGAGRPFHAQGQDLLPQEAGGARHRAHEPLGRRHARGGQGHHPEDIVKARKVVEDVYMDEKIEKYIIDIIFATREPAEYNLQKLQNLIAYGGSPRASISLAKAARAYAFIRRRGYVIPEDVRAVCHDVLRHRIGLTYEAEAENITTEEIITDILNNVIVP